MSFTIEAGKETGLIQINVVPKPMILCQISAVNPVTGYVINPSTGLMDGDQVYLTTTPALGGSTLVYAGNTYQARLMSNVIDQIQAQSPQGYDIPGSVSLTIADGDFVIWTNHANAFGWRGGTLTVTFVLWDAPTAAFSTNAYTWTFILDKPNITGDGIITVAAQARQSMTRINVPNVPRQNRCSHDFPSTAAQRLDGLTNPTSLYYACGYSPDLISIGGVGNATTANLTNPNGSPLTDSAGIYVVCDYTRSCGAGKGTLTQGCMARHGNYAGNPAGGSSADGDITRDKGGRATARFDGDTYLAPVGWSGNKYTDPSAGKLYGFNTPNPATGTTYYNQGYGQQWVDATVLAPFGDPNSDRAECVVCIAPNGQASIITVLVNGVEVNRDNSDVLFTWHVLSLGARKGAVSLDNDYGGHGDPGGSLCKIEVVVPVELVQAGSIPNVQVLVQFPRCLHAYPVASAVISGGNTILTLASGVTNDFNDGVTAGQAFYLQGNSGVPNGGYVASAVTAGPPGTITIPGTWAGTGGAVFYYPIAIADDGFLDSNGAMAENPVWALMDLLTWGPFTVADFDVQTWYDAAQFCAVQIPYTDINGNSATHARYRCSLALTSGTRMSMAKAVLGIRNCAGIILGRNPVNALLQCFMEMTLADQQPAPIPGSNYNIAVASYEATDDPSVPPTGTGYLAYLFDGAGSIEKGTFKLGGRSLNDTPNTVVVPFQDSANVWVQDSCTTIDPKGYTSAGNQEIAAAFVALGLENYDQVTRRSNLELAKAMYGNSRFDAGGTELPSFRATAQAAHLASRVGFICGINYEQLSL
jgi:hypothetical protein